jgi:hypothetical protein
MGESIETAPTESPPINLAKINILKLSAIPVSIDVTTNINAT